MARGEVGDDATRDAAAFPEDSREFARTARPGERSGNRPEGDRRSASPLWDVDQVSAYLGVPVSSVYKMTARSATVRIPHIRIGGRLRFRPTDIDHWLTLLSTADAEALARVRRKALKVTHGDHP